MSTPVQLSVAKLAALSLGLEPLPWANGAYARALSEKIRRELWTRVALGLSWHYASHGQRRAPDTAMMTPDEWVRWAITAPEPLNVDARLLAMVVSGTSRLTTDVAP